MQWSARMLHLLLLLHTLSRATSLHVKIATRPSPLAVKQAERVAETLRRADPALTTELVRISSTGEYRNNTPLPLALDPTVDFTGLLDDAVGSGAVDVAVHSLKDLPPANRWRGDLRVACHLPRTESAADALVGYASMDLVPRGARVGTASLRRRALLRCARPDLDVVTIRGNVHTRLETLDRGDVDALILGAAGLQRLELLDARRHAILSFDEMLPAPAQGIVGAVARGNGGALGDLLARADDRDARIAATAERAVLDVADAASPGTGRPPTSVAMTRDGAAWLLRARLTRPDGSRSAATTSTVEADQLGDGDAAAREFGAAAGRDLLRRAGGASFFAE